MKARVSPAVLHLQTETAFDVLAEVDQLRAQGQDIISFAIGQPDYPTPPHVVEAAVRALRDGHTGYVAPQGIPELREAIAERMFRCHGIDVHPDQVVVFPSAKAALFHCTLIASEAGTEGLYPDPGFPTYPSVIAYGGAEPVGLPLCEDAGFSVDLASVVERLSERTSVLILNSPHNPTGGVIPESSLREIIEALSATPAWLVSDEIYSELYFESPPPSCLPFHEVHDRLMLIDGFSKSYCMPGWRLGYAVVPREIVPVLVRFIVNTVSCTANFVQRAAVEALRGPQDALVAMRQELRARRGLIVSLLNELPGVHSVQPSGAFYAYPNVTQLCRELGCRDAADLRRRFLYEAHVAVLDRGCFGGGIPGETQEYLRFSFACPREQIEEGISRIRRYLTRALG